jgi:hypothetical protein
VGGGGGGGGGAPRTPAAKCPPPPPPPAAAIKQQQRGGCNGSRWNKPGITSCEKDISRKTHAVMKVEEGTSQSSSSLPALIGSSPQRLVNSVKKGDRARKDVGARDKTKSIHQFEFVLSPQYK